MPVGRGTVRTVHEPAGSGNHRTLVARTPRSNSEPVLGIMPRVLERALGRHCVQRKTHEPQCGVTGHTPYSNVPCALKCTQTTPSSTGMTGPTWLHAVRFHS